MKVVVTSGATREPIDSVRFISNLSSGRTGAAICEALTARGFQVTQVAGSRLGAGGGRRAAGILHRPRLARRGAAPPGAGQRLRRSDPRRGRRRFRGGRRRLPTRRSSRGRKSAVKLQPTHKIIDKILGYAGNPNLILVGFKLTHDPDPGAQARAARELLKRSRARYVVQNDVSTLAEGEEHLFFVHENGSSRVRRYVGRAKLATAIAALLEEQLKGSPR